MSGTVYVVHCVDTEGPLHESVQATFERLKAIFGLDLEPSADMLRRLQAGEVDLGGMEAAVQRVVDPAPPRLQRHLGQGRRAAGRVPVCRDSATALRDSAGEGWVYNWFCVDHVDYESNPRRRDMGYHNVFDHYREHAALRRTREQDGLHFHYHPHAFRREAHRCATHWWASSDSLQQILSRRVIDRQWFPAANRPGFHVIRPDSHWFLEQFIPFDFSNQAMVAGRDGQRAVRRRRAGAGVTGDGLRPPGSPTIPPTTTIRCRAHAGAGSRVASTSARGTDCWQKATCARPSREAREGKPVVLAVTDHDFRDMRPDIEGVRGMLARVAADFPGVPFRFSEAVDAMRARAAPRAPAALRPRHVAAGGRRLHTRAGSGVR